MSQTLSQSQTLRVGGKVIGSTQEVVNGALAVIDEQVEIGTDVEHLIAVPYAQLKGLVLHATMACTVKTNSSSEADDTFTLEANKPIVWFAGGITDNPLTADVASLFVTNAAAGLLQFYALYDPTE